MPISPSERVAADIRHAIDQAEFRAGDRLPAERELAAVHRVSSTTVGRAIAQLRAEGYIEVRRGTGAFVLERTPRRWPGLRRPVAPAGDVEEEILPACARIAALLDVKPGTPMTQQRWSISEASRQLALCTSQTPVHPGPRRPAAASEIIAARLPTTEQARALAIPEITPVLVATWIGATAGGQPLLVDQVFAADSVNLIYAPPTAG